MRVCRQHGLRTLALRANRNSDIAAAIAIDLPVLPPSGARERPIDPVEVVAPKKPENRVGADHQADQNHHQPRTWRSDGVCRGV